MIQGVDVSSYQAGYRPTAGVDFVIVKATESLGYVNPDRIVEDELKKGLREIGQTVGWASRWVAIQVGCRVAFGLVIWLTWAWS